MTRAKSLIDKNTKKWLFIMEGELFFSSIPQTFSKNLSKEDMKRFYPYIDFDELEFVEIEVNTLKS